MLAYRQHLTIKNPQHIVLSNLPLKVGQQVEVLILVKEDTVEKTVNSSNQHQQTLTAREESISVPSDTLCEDKTINTSMTTAKPVINPAQAYTDAEWDKLAPDLRCELETQYILNNPILMKQIHDQSEWFPVSLEQLGINLKD
ncbi:MAG: hypothetical protein DRR19_03950 [Candidatus Parabeggiatoa sp. nov. 1]|nr:MAG: hypothetical protein DRR19_03950 [Gammaproteobacteria bacterium]